MSSAATFHRRFRTKPSSKRVPNHKLVLFQVGSEQYAIHIEYVQSILHEFTVEAPLEHGYGLVHANKQVITVLDLALLFDSSNLHGNPKYLIVCRTTAGDLLGFPVVHIPSIVEASEADFCPIPPAYQGRMASKAITQMMSLPNHTTVFYLDLQELLGSQKLNRLS